MNIVTMTTGTSVLSLPAAAIRKVIPARGLTSIPLSREGVIGVVIHDHRAVPVFRLDALRLPGITPSQPDAVSSRGTGQIVILEEEGALAGLLVDDTVTGATAEPEELLDHRVVLAATGMLPDEAWGGTSNNSVRGDQSR